MLGHEGVIVVCDGREKEGGVVGVVVLEDSDLNYRGQCSGQ